MSTVQDTDAIKTAAEARLGEVRQEIAKIERETLSDLRAEESRLSKAITALSGTGRRGRRPSVTVDSSQVLSIVKAAGEEGISGKGVADELGITSQQLKATLDELLESTKVVKTGERKGTRYHIA